MSPVFVPSSGPGDWKSLLADPTTQWARGYSARTLAHSWEDADGFPPEIARTLKQNPAFAGIKPLLVFPEWRVSLPGGSRPSQNDAWVLAKADDQLVSIAIEGKVAESFDKTLGEWKKDASQGKDIRLAFLQQQLGLSAPIPDDVRYQLLHRAASAVVEARRFNASHAVMLVHSFHPDNLWFQDDFLKFLALFGAKANVDQLVTVSPAGSLPLHMGWVHGDERFLTA